MTTKKPTSNKDDIALKRHHALGLKWFTNLAHSWKQIWTIENPNDEYAWGEILDEENERDIAFNYNFDKGKRYRERHECSSDKRDQE